MPLLSQCSKPPYDPSEKVCKQAADKYVQCIGETLGSEMAAAAKRPDKDGVDQCTKDAATVAMYQKCLPVAECGAFLGCLESHARATGGGGVGAGGTRKEQCERHVRDGLRGIAIQTVMLSSTRGDDGKREAQSCIFDESRPLESCLETDERQQLDRYGKQRQNDCEAWGPALASCILGLPDAKDCNPDEYPLWREPIEEGKPGPAVKWSAPVEQKDDDAEMSWSAGGTLVVRDAKGLRGLRAGKEVWRANDSHDDALVIEDRVVGLGSSGGLVIFDAESGVQRAAILADREIVAMAPAAKGQLVALDSQGQSYRVDAKACKGNGKACTSKKATISEDTATSDPTLVDLGDVLVVGEYEAIRAYDAKGGLLFTLHLEDRSALEMLVAVPPKHVAFVEEMGVAILDPLACGRGGAELYYPFAAFVDKSLGYKVGGPPEGCEDCKKPPEGCIAAYRANINGSGEVPVAVPSGGVAFNDHGLLENTHLVDAASAGWTVKTGGRGVVGADASHVYVLSTGHDSEGPVRVLALARADGQTLWQTTLEGVDPGMLSGVAAIAVEGGRLAVLVGDKVHVIEPGE